jgi:hypothetical protein
VAKRTFSDGQEINGRVRAPARDGREAHKEEKIRHGTLGEGGGGGGTPQETSKVLVDEHPNWTTQSFVSQGKLHHEQHLVEVTGLPEEDYPLLVQVGDGRHEVEAEYAQLAYGLAADCLSRGLTGAMGHFEEMKGHEVRTFSS